MLSGQLPLRCLFDGQFEKRVKQNMMDRRRLLLGLLGCAMVGCTTSKKKAARKFTVKKRQPILISKLKAEGIRQEILLYTLSLLDIDYRFGGNHPASGLDCSGMAVYIYQNASGISLPRTAADIAAAATPIPTSQLQAGDLVFFNTTGQPFSHMGLYIGDNKFVHAPKTNSVIQVESLSTPYFAKRFVGGRTVFER